MTKKYQVFISSTYKDLMDERFEVMQTLLTFGCMPAGMELFPAANESQWNFIKKVIDESDYYIIIMGGKYGSINPELGISYTHMEYLYATQIGKPILRFLIKDTGKLPQDKIEKEPKINRKLEEFRKLLMKENLCRFYENPKDLALNVAISINQLINSHPASGWIQASTLQHLTSSQDEVVDFDDVKTQLEKTVIYKMIHLKSIKENQDVVYTKNIPRLNRKISVTSEYYATKINRFKENVNHFKSRDRTNGDALEVNAVLPFKIGLEDGDKRATLIEPVINGPSHVYVVSAHMYNGFRHGDLDLGIKAEKNTTTVRLVVDFSSIVDVETIIPNPPRLFYRCYKSIADIGITEKLIDVELYNFETVTHGVYCAEISDMKKDEGLRFEFSLDIENVANVI